MEQLTLGADPVAAVPDHLPRVAGYDIEHDLAAAGCVAGVDEVGRGAWAGPVTVCAVIVRPGFPAPPPGLTDSKRLSAQRRTAMAATLLAGSRPTRSARPRTPRSTRRA
jgi:ribonuclease HII